MSNQSVKELKEKGLHFASHPSASAASASTPCDCGTTVAAPSTANSVHHQPSASASPTGSFGSGETGEDEEIFFEIPSFELLAKVLLDEGEPIAKRMRTAFLLKQLGDGESIKVLAKGLRSPSVLMAHECGYVLGQLQNKIAIPLLEDVLRDVSVDPIVRHECAEALGAIGDINSEPILREFSKDSSSEVRETCLIALDKLQWNAKNPGVTYPSKYASVDPAPRTDNSDSIAELQTRLMDDKKSHFERYRAMFALRDRDSEEAVKALVTGFSDPSAVFRHEVAYVMGQMAHPAAVQSLKTLVSNQGEHAMVRHEAAEALGAIGDRSSEGITPFLQTFREADNDRIVRESCDVALDLAEYWTSDEVSTALHDSHVEEPNPRLPLSSIVSVLVDHWAEQPPHAQ
jgi:deoxyhypusine monooxygenase